MEARKSVGAPLGLPDVIARSDLLRLMMVEDGIGWCASGETGTAPLSWPEIVAFSAHLGLDEWERGTIRALSLAYLDGLAIGVDPMAPPPNAIAEPMKAKRVLAQGIKAALRGK